MKEHRLEFGDKLFDLNNLVMKRNGIAACITHLVKGYEQHQYEMLSDPGLVKERDYSNGRIDGYRSALEDAIKELEDINKEHINMLKEYISWSINETDRLYSQEEQHS